MKKKKPKICQAYTMIGAFIACGILFLILPAKAPPKKPIEVPGIYEVTFKGRSNHTFFVKEECLDGFMYYISTYGCIYPVKKKVNGIVKHAECKGD